MFPFRFLALHYRYWWYPLSEAQHKTNVIISICKMTQWERSPRGLCGSLWPWKPSLVSGPQGGLAVQRRTFEERSFPVPASHLSPVETLDSGLLWLCRTELNTCTVCVRVAQSWNESSSYRVFFFNWYKKLILARLGVSRPIYVNVDSPTS